MLWFIKNIIRRAFGSRTCFSILLLKFSWLDFSLLRAVWVFSFFWFGSCSCIFISVWFFFFECFPSLLLCRSLFSFHALCHSLFFFSFKRLVADCVPFLLLSSVCLVDWCWCCSASATAPVIDYSVISSNTHTYTRLYMVEMLDLMHISCSLFFAHLVISLVAP